MITPEELYNKVVGVVKEGAEYTQALIFNHLGINSGEESLVAGVETDIALAQAFDTGVTDYEIWRQVEASGGEMTDVEIISKSEASFRVKASINCTLRYLTTYPNLDIQP